MTPGLKGVLREALAPLTNNAWDVIKTWFTSEVVLPLLNKGTMSRVHDIYSALCHLQSAFLSPDPENKPAGG